MHSSGSILTLLCLLLLPALADDINTPAATPQTNAAPAAPAGGDSSAVAQTLSPVNDSGIGSDGAVKDDDSYQARIGELYAPGGESYVMAFYIQPLPAGQQFKTVHLRTQLVGINKEDSLANADLYGLAVRDASKLLPTDYYQGPNHDPKATLLQANFLTPTTKVRADPVTGPFVETSADGDKALAQYLNEIYAKPENRKKYFFLRVSYDLELIPTGNNAYMLLTSRADGDNEAPLLTYTLGPVSKN